MSGGGGGSYGNYAAAFGQAVTALSSAYTQHLQGKLTKAVENWNAQNLQFEAQTVQAESVERFRRSILEESRIIGAIRAKQSASGAEVGAGSTLEMQAEAAAMIRLKALDDYRAGQIEQLRLGKQAALRIAYGKAGMMAGNIQATSTLVSGLGQAAATAYG